MPYIGRSTDGFGVRNRFLYLASADDTSVSGADANGATLTFTDGAYVDVYLNGVLLKAGTDYNTNTANTIASLSAMAANDEVTVVVENFLCQPSMDCSFGDGFQLVAIAEINNVSGCEGYGDFTNLIANLAPGSTNDITFTTGYGDQHVKVWIDFNDDFSFTPDEVVVPTVCHVANDLRQETRQVSGFVAILSLSHRPSQLKKCGIS